MLTNRHTVQFQLPSGLFDVTKTSGSEGGDVTYVRRWPRFALMRLEPPRALSSFKLDAVLSDKNCSIMAAYGPAAGARTAAFHVPSPRLRPAAPHTGRGAVIA